MKTWLAVLLLACGPGEVGAPITGPEGEAEEQAAPIELSELPTADALEGWALTLSPATGASIPTVSPWSEEVTTSSQLNPSSARNDSSRRRLAETS